MSDCCSVPATKKSKSKRQDCPVCGSSSLDVSLKTVMHHIKTPWLLQSSANRQYYFCHQPNCNIVYFSNDAHIIKKSVIRTVVGIKEESESALICYCFGISKADAIANKDAKAFVIQQTRESSCSCESANPSGRCCLKDFS